MAEQNQQVPHDDGHPPAYSSPTNRSGPDFPNGPPGYGGGPSPKRPAGFAGEGRYGGGEGRYESPMHYRESPSGPAPQGAAGEYHTPTHHQLPPPPPPYGSAPPPSYETHVMHHNAPIGGAPPPPPSYEEHMSSQHASRHASPNSRRDGPGGAMRSPGRMTPGGEEVPQNARFRHDPYSPEGSRVVSPNRRDAPSSPTRGGPRA